ncbi:SET domain-containing protein SmydA-8-like [Panulirus ornatus]|uniref:SET domain-containing protein SmydA-8-like n=1 Tax=Panulirus ornatus TaxID=150431 RepID=UPI003A8BD290
MGGVRPCGVCHALASQACGGCGVVHYCGKEHQRQHWPKHRAECRPWKLISTPDAGRFAVASRKLPAGLVFMEEAPLVVGPKASPVLVCLGCHAAITQDDFHPCPECWWPLCSSQCASSPLHLPECSILAQDTTHTAQPKAQGDTSHYDIIFLLRCLLLRSHNPSGWKTLLDMAHHSKQREAEHMASVTYLTEVLHVDYDEEVVRQVKGAIITNAIEISTNTKLEAMYPRVRLLNSSCRPNVELLCGSGAVMQVRTAMPIEVGEPLCFSYTGTMLPVWERQESLRSGYYFKCECVRCADPTELETYFSSPKCPRCRGFYLQPCMRPGDTLWTCPKCKIGRTDSKIQADVQDWLERIQMTDVLGKCSVKHLVTMLDQVKAEFHPQHYVWMRLAQVVLRHLYHNNTEEALQLRSRLWQRLMALHNTFNPGLNRRRGMTLLETGRLMFEAAQKEFEEGDPFMPEFVTRLRSAVEYLEEAGKILRLEPPGTKLAAMAVRAREKKAEVEEFLEQFGCGELRAE